LRRGKRNQRGDQTVVDEEHKRGREKKEEISHPTCEGKDLCLCSTSLSWEKRMGVSPVSCHFFCSISLISAKSDISENSPSYHLRTDPLKKIRTQSSSN